MQMKSPSLQLISTHPRRMTRISSHYVQSPQQPNVFGMQRPKVHSSLDTSPSRHLKERRDLVSFRQTPAPKDQSEKAPTIESKTPNPRQI
jgi:hypothetical protein